MQNILISFLLLVVAFMSTTGAYAFRFSPFRAKFEPSGAKANNTFLIENNSSEPASVQIRITTREVDINGVEQNQDNEKNFRIYPAQMVLKPHSKRSVRVQWVGDSKLKEEKAYRIIAEQLPIKLDKKQSKKKFG
jgi:fimbrial chaperone protein